LAISSIMNVAISCVQDHNQEIRQLWGRWEERYCDGGPHSRNVTPIFNTITASTKVKSTMKLNHPTLSFIIYRGQQANGTSGTQKVMRGGRSYLPAADMLALPPEHMIDENVDELEDDGARWHQHPGSFPTMKTGFPKFKSKPHRWILWQQGYLEVIRNRAVGVFADYKQTFVAREDMAWLSEHCHIVTPPAAGSFASRTNPSSRPPPN